MELLSTRHLISTPQRSFPVTNSDSQLNIRRIGSHVCRYRTHVHYKNSGYQDFQTYAKPSRLVSATEANTCTELSLEKLVRSFKSETLYKIELQTSNEFGSGLTDINSGILLCVIDENGDSILQRLPAYSRIEQHMQSEDEVDSDVLHFKRGSVDMFTFEGPKLQKIKALWMSPESGQWRLGGASLSCICVSQSLTEENGKIDKSLVGLRYDFVAEDIQLGEGSDNSMTELKPYSVTEFSGDNFTSLSENLLQSSLDTAPNVSNEESMMEYKDLKNSLLLYDTLLIFAGSVILSLSSEETAAFAFLTGGISGFLYLLLLQRYVDQLPAPGSNNGERKSVGESLASAKGTVSILAVLLAFTAILVKFGSENFVVEIAPIDLVFGMMGFLTCKVAVLLASFKPMSASQRKIQ